MISAELGKPLEQFVVELVATGRYGSKSEVLREGVRLIQEREARLAAMDAAVARGIGHRGLAVIPVWRTHVEYGAGARVFYLFQDQKVLFKSQNF